MRGGKDFVVAREKIMSLQSRLGMSRTEASMSLFHHVATVDDAWMLLKYESFLIISKILFEGSCNRGRDG